MLENPQLKSSRIFFLLATIATMTTITDLLVIIAPNEGTALIFAHPLVLLSILLAFTMLYLTAYLPYEREGSWLIRHKRGFAVLALLIAFVPALFISTVAENQYGWWVPMSSPVIWWYSSIYVIYTLGIISMIRLYRKEKRKDVKHRIIPPIACHDDPDHIRPCPDRDRDGWRNDSSGPLNGHPSVCYLVRI